LEDVSAAKDVARFDLDPRPGRVSVVLLPHSHHVRQKLQVDLKAEKIGYILEGHLDLGNVTTSDALCVRLDAHLGNLQ